MTRNEKDIRDVVLRIIDEFKLIRTNAPGLEKLPPLNLGACVPSFFNNPSFSLTRESPSDDEDGPSTAPHSVRKEDAPAPAKTDPPTALPSIREEAHEAAAVQPRARKVSGLLHLVSRSRARERPTRPPPAAELPEPARPPGPPGEEEDGGEEDEPRARAGPVARQVVVRRRSGVAEAQLQELRRLHAAFNERRDELMSAVDRKVDRDMIERLFNKFRSLILGVNDRVNELAGMMGNCATQHEVDAVAKIVTQMPVLGEKSAAVKVGPECICCGRAKSALSGQVPASTAISGAGVTVSVQTPNDGGGFVYGDGGAYRARGLLDSFSRLPPLSSQTARRQVKTATRP
jgi:hypothetical protein